MKKMLSAVIGEPNVVKVFAAFGFDVFTSARTNSVRETIKSLASKGYHLILITESCAVELKDFINSFCADAYPVILPIPDGVKSLGLGSGIVEENTKKVYAKKGEQS